MYAVTSDNDDVTSSHEETPAEALLRKAWGVVQAVMGLGVVQKVRQAINPPVAAVIAGKLVGAALTF